MTGAISFNTNSFQTYDPSTRVGIITEDINFSDVAARDMPMYPLALANRSVITTSDYPNKAISINGTIIGSSLTDIDSRMDAFRGFLRGIEKNLDINFNGATRRFIASANAVSVVKKGKQLYAKFTVQFICSIPFGADVAATTALTATGRTANSYADAYTFLGTAPYQKPKITITYTAVTGGGTYMSFGNANNGQSVNITGITFAPGDVLVIDPNDASGSPVRLNGVPINYTGAIPEFEPGLCSFNYADGFTTRTFNILVEYNKLYL